MKQAFSAILALLLSMPLMAQLSMLKISEVLYCPASGGAEYVEIYNSGSQSVVLSDLYFARLRGDTVLKLYPVAKLPQTMEGHAYYVFTKDSADIVRRYSVKHPARIVQMASMPSLTNGSGTVMICYADTSVIERFDYSDAMHNPLVSNIYGVALERRSMEAAANNPDNWSSASAASGYGTPTYVNSNSVDGDVSNDEFSVSSETISPDGDGYQDEVEVTYTLASNDVFANIFIVDSRGRQVRRLLRNSPLGSSGAVMWNGHDDNGARCQRGNYILMIETYTIRGTHKTLKKVISLID